MQKVLKHIRDTVISGLLLMIPAFVLIVLIQKLYNTMTGVGAKIADTLGIKTVGGIGAASIATSLVLVAIFYGCGLLVKLAFVTSFKDWLEENLLQYIPGYLSYKSKMEDKLVNRTEPRKSVLAKINNGWRPAFLVNRQEGNNVVFVPQSPETEIGEIWVLQDQDVKEAGIEEKVFKAMLQKHGKGLVVDVS